jgi:hypothetical protein
LALQISNLSESIAKERPEILQFKSVQGEALLAFFAFIPKSLSGLHFSGALATSGETDDALALGHLAFQLALSAQSSADRSATRCSSAAYPIIIERSGNAADIFVNHTSYVVEGFGEATPPQVYPSLRTSRRLCRRLVRKRKVLGGSAALQTARLAGDRVSRVNHVIFSTAWYS